MIANVALTEEEKKHLRLIHSKINGYITDAIIVSVNANDGNSLHEFEDSIGELLKSKKVQILNEMSSSQNS